MAISIIKKSFLCWLASLMILSVGICNEGQEIILPEIVKNSGVPSKYERILMTSLRDKETSIKEFREATQKIGTLLVNKVIECLPTKSIAIATPVNEFDGEMLATNIEIVSVMRSGDALLDTFINYFPEAAVSKFLIQRDEETAEAHFKYMKLSPTIASGNPVIILEPMIATGGTLTNVIGLLKESGVLEKNIIIASVCTAPEGLRNLNEKFPAINVVMTVMDKKLNESKYIVPGLGDFGDRYFGTIN